MGISLLLAFPSAIAPPLHITQNIDDLSLQLLYLWLQQPLDLHLNARIAIKTWLLVLQAWLRASPCGSRISLTSALINYPVVEVMNGWDLIALDDVVIEVLHH